MKKADLSETDLKIIRKISYENGLAEKEVKEIVSLLFGVVDNVMQRGMNFKMCGVVAKVKWKHISELRLQRLGDQKAIVKCVRFGGKINFVRKQTITKWKKSFAMQKETVSYVD